VLAGLAQGRDDPHVGGQGAGAVKLGGIAELGDEPRGRLRPDAVDGGEQAADLVVLEEPIDVALELAQPRPPALYAELAVAGARA
jgi:hypothetical protein